MKTSILSTILCFALNFSLWAQDTNALIFLENNDLKVGIVCNAGGRLVYLGTHGGDNIIHSDFDELTHTFPEVIAPSDTAGFIPYNGFITWLGPQSQWWQQQNVNLNRKNAQAVWPPDPYIIYGEFEVKKRKQNSLSIVGKPSPISGVQLMKTFKLKGDQLHITVEAINTSSKTVSWDIWSNIRVDGSTPFFVPGIDAEMTRITPRVDDQHQAMNHLLEDGLFTTILEKPSGLKPMRHMKAFLYPEHGEIFAFPKNHLLQITFDKVPNHKIHPEQGFVEIYNLIAHDASLNLLELEHHGPYTAIEPGSSLFHSETWTVRALENDFDIDQFKNKHRK